MSEDGLQRPRPSWAVFSIAAAIAAPAGYLLPSIWHSSTLLGAGLAVTAASICVAVPQNLVEAVITALISWLLFISFLPEGAFVTGIVLPLVAGTTIGLLVGSTWKRFHG